MSFGLAFLTVAVAGIGTYAMRAGLIVALADKTMPPLVERALSHVPAAVLAAMVVTLAADPSGGGLGIDETAALTVAVVVSVWRKQLLITLVAGMATLFAVAAML